MGCFGMANKETESIMSVHAAVMEKLTIQSNNENLSAYWKSQNEKDTVFCEESLLFHINGRHLVGD